MKFWKLIRSSCAISSTEHVNDELHSLMDPNPFRSSLIDDCIGRAKDLVDGGSLYSADGGPTAGSISAGDALAGIEAAGAAGLFPIKINAVLIKGFNDDELMDLAGLSLKEDVHVRFIELMPIGEGCRFWPEGYLPAEEAIAMMPGLICLDESDGVAQSWRLPGARGTVGFIKPVSHHFCGSCNRLRLTADGMLKPCLHSDSEIPVRGLRGDALQAAFEAAIRHKPAENREMSAEAPSRAGRSMNRIGG